MIVSSYFRSELLQIFQDPVTHLEEYISEKKRFKVRPYTKIRCKIHYKNVDFQSFNTLFCKNCHMKKKGTQMLFIEEKFDFSIIFFFAFFNFTGLQFKMVNSDKGIVLMRSNTNSDLSFIGTIFHTELIFIHCKVIKRSFMLFFFFF